MVFRGEVDSWEDRTESEPWRGRREGGSVGRREGGIQSLVSFALEAQVVLLLPYSRKVWRAVNFAKSPQNGLLHSAHVHVDEFYFR